MTDRLEICKNCAIYNEQLQQCSASLYLDPVNNIAYITAYPGTYRGCGCYIPTKIKNINNHCPARKW